MTSLQCSLWRKSESQSCTYHNNVDCIVALENPIRRNYNYRNKWDRIQLFVFRLERLTCQQISLTLVLIATCRPCNSLEKSEDTPGTIMKYVSSYYERSQPWDGWFSSFILLGSGLPVTIPKWMSFVFHGFVVQRVITEKVTKTNYRLDK